ncbi:MAG: NAD(P)/FAD-dependent oxidoreductase [Flavobacteriales bacterium]|nr:NAD(P)/FAD-dependent oxidoreductase [Flavobacteriales bacterium]
MAVQVPPHIHTDVCIIGAGPVGLFAVFECGLIRLRCHLVDYLPRPGGQLSEIYPKKPIYDIPGYPCILAQELVDKLLEQIRPFKPGFTLGERVESLVKNEDGSFTLQTHKGTTIHAGAVAIAAGLGCFEPRKPDLPELALYEGKGLDYMVSDPEQYRGKAVVVAGGGDSALDWAIQLCQVARHLTLIHRSSSFRAAPHSVERAYQLAAEGKIEILVNTELHRLLGNGRLEAVEVRSTTGEVRTLEADACLPLFGLSPKLGPIARWGLDIQNNQIPVDTEKFQTSVPGIFAIGDINTYPGKLRLILCGFHEAALMAQAAFRYIRPHDHLSFKYTTVTGIQGL